ncbi:MAG: tRNA threonylcarbamoyladenosine dehydratase [Clostridia bacterium]|nr:tRNA threonylcarbamoyladenosine dehydratase [Clostridia bacterium]
MADFYTRTELLLGKEGVERLKNANVLLFGVGGVGGSTAEALVRAGVGKLTLFDGDVYAESNLNRQNFSTVAAIGQPKAEHVRAALLEIAPQCEITAVTEMFSTETDLDFSAYSYIVDAVDDTDAKTEIARRAAACGVPCIASMGAGNKLDPTAFAVTDIYKTSVCPLAKIMRRRYRQVGIERLKVVYSTEAPRDISANLDASAIEAGKKTVGSLSFVPSVAGLILAGEVIKDIADVH